MESAKEGTAIELEPHGQAVITEEEVTRFLYDEADLLDRHQYEDWFGIVSEDIDYKVPVLRTRTDADGGHERAKLMFFFDENWGSLSWRVKILSNPGTYNWVENPRSLTRRIIGNIRILENGEGRCVVRNNFSLYRGIGGRLTYDLITGQRFDTIRRRGDGALCLAKRLVHLDQSLFLSSNLSFLL